MQNSVFQSLFLIQGALKVQKKNVVINFSKSNIELCRILKQQGFIFFKFRSNNSIKIYIKQNSNLKTFCTFQILKKKKKRILLSNKCILNLKKVFLNKFLVFSTTQGILSDLDILKRSSLDIKGYLICVI